MMHFKTVFFLLALASANVSGKAQVSAGQTVEIKQLEDGEGREDLRLVRAERFSRPDEFAHYHGAGNSDKPMRNKSSNFVARYNPVSLAFKGAMLIYQRALSEQLAKQCPYEISCSNFSKLSIQEFGMFKGVFIGADRLLRCNRIGILDIHSIDINPITGGIIDPPNLYR
jgi:putative component of membrane protein insertase Oxa1/YidC/SpoIIIJ protein YidD